MKTLKVIQRVMLVLLLITAGQASAAFTSVSGPAPGEISIDAILSGIYGEAFSPVYPPNGLAVYTSANYTATRVDDNPLGGNLNLYTSHAGDAVTDQVWQDGVTLITAEAKYADYSQAFGYKDADGYHELMEYQGSNGFINVSAANPVHITGTWEWMRSNANGNSTLGSNAWSSVEGNNADEQDHMITYEISGPTGAARTWLVFWDDSGYDDDGDFNDFVIELRANPIPAPGALLLGGIGIAFVGWLRRKNSL